jgi:hypothetical protein
VIINFEYTVVISVVFFSLLCIIVLLIAVWYLISFLIIEITNNVNIYTLILIIVQLMRVQ